MDDLLNELNEEVAKTKPKKQLKDTSAELGKQLEEKLNRLQRDSCICKKPKLTTDKPRTMNREFIYSGSSFQPKSRSTQRRAKTSLSRLKVTEETEESPTGMISYSIAYSY